MKPLEIIWILFLVVISLIISNFLTGSMALHGAFHRLVVRAFFQVLLLGMLYLYYESRDMSSRLSALEEQIYATENDSNPEQVEIENQIEELTKGDSDG